VRIWASRTDKTHRKDYENKRCDNKPKRHLRKTDTHDRTETDGDVKQVATRYPFCELGLYPRFSRYEPCRRFEFTHSFCPPSILKFTLDFKIEQTKNFPCVCRGGH